ncbi:hypothetical protein LIER_40997 [Lithospermum erythrorhizon]|uniref:Uncharacterized protein n=1 Tax=Lithospermum erythrorhizon TaxID=34254 RepID=A0AAV3R8L8_LITER
MLGKVKEELANDNPKRGERPVDMASSVKVSVRTNGTAKTHALNVGVCDGSRDNLWISAVYGDNDYKERKKLWASLIDGTFGVVRKLDRLLCNEKWLVMHGCEVTIPAASISDHCPIDVCLQNDLKTEPKPFRFFSFWTKHESYNRIIKEAWEEEVEGNGFQVLQTKLKSVKDNLKVLNKEAYSNISCRVVEGSNELEIVHARFYGGDLDPNLLVHMKELEGSCMKLMEAEKSFYRDKSRATWLEEVDANTSFFHLRLKVEQVKNRIHQIRDANGNMLTDYEDIVSKALDEFGEWSGLKPNLDKSTMYVAGLSREKSCAAE